MKDYRALLIKSDTEMMVLYGLLIIEGEIQQAEGNETSAEIKQATIDLIERLRTLL